MIDWRSEFWLSAPDARDRPFNKTDTLYKFLLRQVWTFSCSHCWAPLQDVRAQSVCFPCRALRRSDAENWPLTGTSAEGNERAPSGGNSIWAEVRRNKVHTQKRVTSTSCRGWFFFFLPPVCYNKTNPLISLIENKLLMHDAVIYLQDPAHPELPERAQPPSALRPLVQSPRFPDGGDVIRWLGQQVTGPGTGRHKLRVRFQKKKKEKRIIFLSEWLDWKSPAHTFASSELSRSLMAAIRVQLRQPEKNQQKKKQKQTENGWALNSARMHTCSAVI